MTDAERLVEVLRGAVAGSLSGEEVVAVSYSGGLDSSVIARLASEIAEVRAYTCAVPGSFDDRNAGACANEEGLILTLVRLEPREVKAYVKLAAGILQSMDPVEVAYTVPILRVVDVSTERATALGSGADELFAGYARYADMDEPAKAMADDIRKMRAELDRTESYARSKGKTLAAPFTAEPVIAFASTLPLERKLSGDSRKIILREAAKLLGLPSSTRPKKAAQYSSGVLKEMERQAKADGLVLREWVSRTVTNS